MEVHVSGKSDVGRVRSVNEDNHLVCWPVLPGVGVFVVADGVGGAKHGEVASDMFVQEVGRRVMRSGQEFSYYDITSARVTREKLLSMLSSIIKQTNRRIFGLSQQDPELEGMCTTGVVMVLANDGVFLAHAGDSRCYLIRGGQIHQLTHDHTLANQLISNGLLDASQLEDFPFSHVITRSFGSKSSVEFDTLFLESAPGDRFVLCTDGLHNHMTPEEVMQESLRFQDPEMLVDRLIAEANARGGKDNITVVVIDKASATFEAETAILTLERKLDVMRRLFLFMELNDEELMRVMQIVYSMRKSRGEIIIREGASGNEFFIVIEGLVDISLEGRYLTSIAPGGHFGEMALIDDHFRSATATAKTDVVLLTIQRDDFQTLLETEGDMVKKLLFCFLGNLAGRVRDLSCEMVELNEELSVLKRKPQ